MLSLSALIDRLASAMPSGIAFVLRPSARSLILDPGGGLDAGLALASGASSVDVPTDERLIVEALRGPYGSFSFHLLDNPRLRLLSTTSRGALSRMDKEYDVIDFALAGRAGRSRRQRGGGGETAV